MSVVSVAQDLNQRAQSWFQEGGFALLAILAAATAVRGSMLVDFLKSNPTADFVQGDAGVYWESAGRIAAGRIIDDAPFFSIPLYTFFLAGIRMLGGGLLTVYVVQIFLHLVTAAGLFYVTVRKFDRATGLVVCGLFLLLREPAFLVTRVLPSTIQLFLVVGLMAAAHSVLIATSKRAAAVLGLLTGMFTLSYPAAMLLVPVLLPWVGWRIATRRGWQRGTIALACGSLVVLLATLHNWLACGEFLPVTAHAGITFRQGNAPGADGLYTPIEGVSAVREEMHADAAAVFAREHGRAGSNREIDQYFQQQGWDYLTDDPVRAVRLISRKTYWFLTGRHYSDIYYPSLEQADGWLNLLPLAPIPTAWLMGPAMAGLVIFRRLRKWNGADAAMIVLPLLVVAGFWYSPRYRLPAVPPLAMLAAAAGIFAVRNLVAATKSVNGQQPRYSPGADAVAVLSFFSVMTGPINAATGFDFAEAYRPQYEFNRGQVYMARKQYGRALERLMASDRLSPDQPPVLAALAKALAHLDRRADAEVAVRRLVNGAPDLPSSWLAAGGIYLNYAEWAEAEESFSRCLKLDPRNTGAHVGMWMAMSRQGRADEAIRHLRTAVELAPGNPLVACEWGLWLADHGPSSEAEQQLRACINLAPDRPDAHLVLGKLFAQRGLREEAIACYWEVMRLDPGQEDEVRRLARELGDPESTRAMYAAIEQTPSDGSLYSRLAATLYAQGDVAGAVSVLQKAVVRAEDTTTVALELAWLLATAADDNVRQGEEAVRLAQGVCGRQLGASPECLDVLAAALAETGEFEAAVRQAEQAIALATAQGRVDAAERIRKRLDLYQSGRPYRQ